MLVMCRNGQISQLIQKVGASMNVPDSLIRKWWGGSLVRAEKVEPTGVGPYHIYICTLKDVLQWCLSGLL